MKRVIGICMLVPFLVACDRAGPSSKTPAKPTPQRIQKVPRTLPTLAKENCPVPPWEWAGIAKPDPSVAIGPILRQLRLKEVATARTQAKVQGLATEYDKLLALDLATVKQLARAGSHADIEFRDDHLVWSDGFTVEDWDIGTYCVAIGDFATSSPPLWSAAEARELSDALLVLGYMLGTTRYNEVSARAPVISCGSAWRSALELRKISDPGESARWEELLNENDLLIRMSHFEVK